MVRVTHKSVALLTVSVSVFNGGPTDVTFIVNRGKQFLIPGVGDGAVWAPAQLPTPQQPGPRYNNGGPVPDAFGPGQNCVQFLVGTSSFYKNTVTVPSAGFTSLQFYLLLGDATHVDWLMCTDGMVVDFYISHGSP